MGSTVAERHVKLFRNGRNQAVRIPREFELPGEDAIMHKDGVRLIIEPAPPRSLLALSATLEPIDDEFPPIDDQPAETADWQWASYLIPTSSPTSFAILNAARVDPLMTLRGE